MRNMENGKKLFWLSVLECVSLFLSIKAGRDGHSALTWLFLFIGYASLVYSFVLSNWLARFFAILLTVVIVLQLILGAEGIIIGYTLAYLIPSVGILAWHSVKQG